VKLDVIDGFSGKGGHSLYRIEPVRMVLDFGIKWAGTVQSLAAKYKRW
jgi:hypothetical protein